MVVRRRKKSRKHRGSRTCGWGITGQHRGKGSKGGFGRSGRHKHHWTWVRRHAPDYFGKHGFKTPLSIKPRERIINVGLLDEMASKLVKRGKAELKENKIVINVLELGFNKVLGRGKVTHPLVVITPHITKKAEEKISQAGGEVIKI